MLSSLAPAAALYRAITASKNGAYDHQFLTPRRLTQPVISIGNLSVGGAGKTPLVVHLARLLAGQGMAVDVLSRGYGRTSSRTARVDPEAPGAAALYGDEPVLIAASARCSVYVGASRYQAGLLAEQQSPRIHLLDDGFQHRRLFRDIDIVVLHRSDFTGKLLPAGRLREPLTSLRRASILILRAEDADLELDLRRRGLTAPIWRVERRLAVPDDLTRAVAFCGIARPDEFFTALPEPILLSPRAFRDHHRYTDGDMRDLLALARERGASTFVTTEKDLVRLSPAQRMMLAESATLVAARLEVRLHDEARVLTELLAQLPSALPWEPETTTPL